MKDLVLEISGGVLQEVYCDDPTIRVVVINWDDAECPEMRGEAGFVWDPYSPLTALPDDAHEQFRRAIKGELSCEPTVILHESIRHDAHARLA